MKLFEAREALESMLSESAPDRAALLQWVEDDDSEGLYHDFKGGEITDDKKPKEIASILREYVSGFANAVGGFFVLGYSQQKKAYNGFSAPGGNGHEWATRVLEPLAPYFSTPPRIFQVEFESGSPPVLIVAVDRAPSLVPCSISGEATFFFRMGDSTVRAPSYLVSDLLLGRRSQPSFGVTAKVTNIACQSPYEKFRFDLAVEIENQSLVHGDEIQIGLVSHLNSNRVGAIGTNLRKYFDVIAQHEGGELHRNLASGDPFGLLAFQRENRKVGGIVCPWHEDLRSVTLGLALYILPKAATPEWFQLELVFNNGNPGILDKVDIRLARALGKRPVVRHDSK